MKKCMALVTALVMLLSLGLASVSALAEEQITFSFRHVDMIQNALDVRTEDPDYVNATFRTGALGVGSGETQEALYMGAVKG